MDNQKYKSNLIHNILKQGDYYISVSGKTDESWEVFSSIDKKTHHISWFDGVINIDSNSHACPDYAVPQTLDSFIQKVCDQNQFKKEFVEFNNAPVFPKHERLEKANQLDYIYKDMMRKGLQPYHISLARDTDILYGLCSILKTYYDIEIKT
jgi:hypothetical protein